MQHVDVAEALFLESAERPPQVLELASDDVRAEVAVRPDPVARLAHLLSDVEHDRHGYDVVAPRQLDQRLACARLDVGCVDDGEPPRCQALGSDEVQHLEGIRRGALIVLVVGDQPATGIRREDFGRQEVAAREGGLAGA